jgi:hypothetical protein
LEIYENSSTWCNMHFSIVEYRIDKIKQYFKRKARCFIR